MNEIAALARTTAYELSRRAGFTPRLMLRRVLKFMIGAIIRSKDDDIARLYEGSAWSDSTEHDLNDHVTTGRRARR
jgi:hypothetical protein